MVKIKIVDFFEINNFTQRQNFFSGKAKQNKVGAKARQVFFSSKAKQNI